MPALWFLLGLGIIMAIVGANSLYDFIREKKGITSGDSDEVLENVTGAVTEEIKKNKGFHLADVICQKLSEGQMIFGVPLKICEGAGEDTMIALDREENIYVIETALREGYEDLYDQVRDDLSEQRRRIIKGDRRVYAIVCTNEPSPALKAAMDADPFIRIFAFDITFKSIF